MARISKVIKGFIAKLPGSGHNQQVAAVEEFAGDERKTNIYGPINEDSSPPETLKTINLSLGSGRGFLVSVAYNNELIEPVATPGERRLYSTNATGDVVMAETFYHADGTIRTKNAIGTSEILPDGTITLKNAEVDMTMSPNGTVVTESDNARITMQTDGRIELKNKVNDSRYVLRNTGSQYMYFDANNRIEILVGGVINLITDTSINLTAPTINLNGNVVGSSSSVTFGAANFAVNSSTFKHNNVNVGETHAHWGTWSPPKLTYKANGNP